MDKEFEKYHNRCGIQKSDTIRIIVKETSRDYTKKAGKTLLTKTCSGFSSMHAVIKSIYETLPEYKGRRIYVEVWNTTNGMVAISNMHYVPKNRIPFTL